MSKKVLGIGFAIAGMALMAIPGIGTAIGLGMIAKGISVAAVVGLGMTVGANFLIGPAKPKGLRTNPGDRLFASLDVSAPRKIVFGDTAMATDVRYQAFTGAAQEYLEQIICVASHEVQSIDEIWLDNEKAWTAAGGAQGRYVGYLTVTARAVGTAANGIAIDSVWTTSCTLTGCAYVHLKCKLTGDSKKAESPFSGGLTNRVTIRGKGAKVYDPRLDSTVSGGVGTQRANDQTTWAWSADASRNPALQELWYELGWKIAGKLAVGKGIPPARLNLPSYATAANVCDEAVTKSAANGGGTEPRYRSDGALSESDDPGAVRDTLCATMNAVLRDAGGKLALTVLKNDLATPVTPSGKSAFDESDVLGEMAWEQTPDLNDVFNIVRGRRVDPSDNALYQLAEYPAVSLASADGIDRIDTFDLPMVQSNGQAQRLAKQRLQRNQYQGRLSFTGGPSFWGLSLGDVFPLTHSAFGWSAKLFRCAGHKMGQGGAVEIIAVEENAAIYQWDNNEAAAVAAGAPTVYDPLNDAVVQGLTSIESGESTIVSRLSSTTGRATSLFASVTDGRPFGKIADQGEAHNGDAVTFRSTLAAVPKVSFLPGGIAPGAGKTIAIRADNLTVSGFTMKATEQTVTAGATITDTASQTVTGSSAPDYQINKSDAGSPYDGKYKYTFTVNVPELAPGEPGSLRVGIYALSGGIWVEVGSSFYTASGTYSLTVSPGAVDFNTAAGVYEFGIDKIDGNGTITSFGSVAYTLGTVSETALTTATNKIPWIAMLEQ